MMKLIKYNNVNYPSFQTDGYAAQFAIPFAKHFCIGKGFDIGCMKKEWSYPGSFAIDLTFDDEYDAFNLPDSNVDYIFSSHCLEHIGGDKNWVDALNYWTSKIKSGGILFLYLPHFDQKYWRPWNNRKHTNIFNSDIIKSYMEDTGYINIFVSGKDLNDSFMVVGEKK